MVDQQLSQLMEFLLTKRGEEILLGAFLILATLYIFLRVRAWRVSRERTEADRAVQPAVATPSPRTPTPVAERPREPIPTSVAPPTRVDPAPEAKLVRDRSTADIVTPTPTAESPAEPAPVPSATEPTPVAALPEEQPPLAVPVVAPPSAVGAGGGDVRRGLQKTRTHLFSRIRNLFTGSSGISDDFFPALEEILITSDLGVKTTTEILDRLKRRLRERPELTEDDLRQELREYLLTFLRSDLPAEINPRPVDGKPKVVVVVGVNGVGKTTTIGKLAKRFRNEGARVVVGAGDTFRAAAVEQLDIWGERSGVEVVKGEEGAKPSTVAYQAVHKAIDGAFDVLIMDTAGRLHTRVNLMNELAGVMALIEREQPGAPHEVILVLDAVTGQNALQQAREFHSKVRLTGVVVTKLDGTPKGGIVVAIKNELNVPVRYIGVGEGADDLRVFSADEFVDGMLAGELPTEGDSRLSERGRVRRRRRVGDDSGDGSAEVGDTAEALPRRAAEGSGE